MGRPARASRSETRAQSVKTDAFSCQSGISVRESPPRTRTENARTRIAIARPMLCLLEYRIGERVSRFSYSARITRELEPLIGTKLGFPTSVAFSATNTPSVPP